MCRANGSRIQTRTRILNAALQVFAQAGVQGATTREIARVAGVNEVTLFRHFISKELLLTATIQQVLAVQNEALTRMEEWTQDLYGDLKYYAGLYNQTLEEYEDLVRTFIGEARRRPETTRQVIQQAVQPLRGRLVAYLHQAQQEGRVRSQVNPEAAIDLFTGMLLAGMLLRGAATIPLAYEREHYLESCVDIFVSGIQTHAQAVTTFPSVAAPSRAQP
ncbi:TetR/AcrR family transcriptional regulator [Anthocerotibacter panamensis]|uniref:TetR/AcrR family transcriptional regulator n=1 Tax=Anthocerotibacter panamensis TaxID=2857077 RepID=UPI001C407C07|nr:TetR/AcrR family transcriptional regulator [Anthocerotibacter panamensis]